MQHEISCAWQDNMSFNTSVNGHTIVLDADESFGGEDKGPRPKPLLLSALAGCTGMDVVSILRKMRIPFTFFNILITGTISNGNTKFYEKIHITYQFKSSEDLNPEKVQQAVDLSQDVYCGVSYMLKKAAELSFEIEYI